MISIIKRILVCVVVILMAIGLMSCLKKKKVQKIELEDEITVMEDPNEPKEDMIPRPDLQPKLKEAQEKYKEAVAWLYIPESVDLPVMLCSKDSGENDGKNRYYRHAEDGSYRLCGSVYTFPKSVIDSREKLSRNLVLMGHHIEGKNELLLGPLEKFYEFSFTKKHPYVFLAIPGENLIFEIFAVYVTEVPARKYNKVGFCYYFSVDPANETPDNPTKGGDGSLPAQFVAATDKSWVQIVSEEAKKRSLYNYEGISIDKDDKIITLTTCTYIFGKTGSKNCLSIEFVIQGKLLTPERKLRDEARVKKNQNPKWPNLPEPKRSFKYEAEDGEK
ncbi:MAG: class B sortase [Oscillospiraceae bacterium]|jgi:hypothetical protein|nr:class B sortase [Oscillospiraceae bacterium]